MVYAQIKIKGNISHFIQDSAHTMMQKIMLRDYYNFYSLKQYQSLKMKLLNV